MVKKQQNVIIIEDSRGARERNHLGDKRYINMASAGNKNPSPVDRYRTLHSHPAQAIFSGDHKRPDEDEMI